MRKVTVRAGSNIAFIKYWGVDDLALNLPQTNSISMTLAGAHTTTTVEWMTSNTSATDEIVIDGVRLAPQPAQRLITHLDRIRALAGVSMQAHVESCNNFPMASGIASSASGFAALSAAATLALDLELPPARLSALARLGSGSACRSIFGGFVEWERGHDDATSVARSLFPPEHWDLVDIVAVVSDAAKQVSSAGGHRLAVASPLNAARVASAKSLLPKVRAALAARDLTELGHAVELDALAMHAVMMTSTPSLLYWLSATVDLIHAVYRWRHEDGLTAYFTIDAGPNVHILCERQHVAAVCDRLAELAYVQNTIVSGPGPAPLQLDEHLF
jgi:diphosphomevalonate decarboxylase